MINAFFQAERERLVALDPAMATPEDHVALYHLMKFQLSELGDQLSELAEVVGRLRASHDRLLAAAKDAYEATDRVIGPVYGYGRKCLEDLQAAISEAEKLT